MSTYRFDPDYCVPPGTILKEWMEVRGASDEEAAFELNLSLAELEGLLVGDTPINAGLAMELSAWTLISERMWLGAEKRFRHGIATGKSVVR